MVYNYIEIYNESDALMLQDADDVITKCELWDWIKEYTPEEGKGFMFSDHPNLITITKFMTYPHSGSSYAWTMRTIEYIAKNGWETLYNEKISHKQYQENKRTEALKFR